MFLKAGLNTVHPLKQEPSLACPVRADRTLCPVKRSYLLHLYLPTEPKDSCLDKQEGSGLDRQGWLYLECLAETTWSVAVFCNSTRANYRNRTMICKDWGSVNSMPIFCAKVSATFILSELKFLPSISLWHTHLLQVYEPPWWVYCPSLPTTVS